MSLWSKVLASTALCASLALAGTAGAQTVGTVTGQVTNQAGQPLAGVQIHIEGTTIGTLTNDSGRYALVTVPPGARRVIAIFLGFSTVTLEVTVTADQATTANFELSQTAIALDAVVVTATGEQRKRELGTTVGTVQASAVMEVAPITNAFDLLQARMPGVQVMNPGGAIGSGSRIRIRGSNSISLSNEPIIYVDGIRIESGHGFGFGTGGQTAGRLNDINPEDIESIEVIKGPAAATLYGTQAANGVIRITTKKGQAGPAKWTFWAEGGAVEDPNTYPDNWRAEDSSGSRCRLDLQASGGCTVANLFNYTVLEDDDLSPFGTGWRQQYGVNVTGGTERVNYYISGEWEEEVGPYELKPFYAASLQDAGFSLDGTTKHPQRVNRLNFRVNLTAQVMENAVLSLRTAYVDSRLSTTGNDNNSFGVLPSGYFGGAKEPAAGTDSGAYGFQSPDQLYRRDMIQEVDRFMTAANFTWSPLGWLDVRATAGVDWTQRQDVSHIPRNLVFVSGASLGERSSDFTRIYQHTLDVGATATYDLTPEIRTRTAVGAQLLKNFMHGNDAYGEDIVTGSKSLASAAASYSVNEGTTEFRTFGLYVEEQISYLDRLFLTGAVRMDDNTAFGKDFDAVIYPKLSASYLISEESWFPDIGFLDQFRIRTAWGMSGVQPSSTAAIRTLSAIAITDPGGASVSGVTIGGIGNVELKPEKSTEIEGGFDADMLEGRLGLEATYYHKKTKDALISRELPPSYGASANRWENLASVKNSGFEASLSFIPVDNDFITWDFTLAGSINDNEVVELGEGVEPIGSTLRHVPGFPIGGRWDKPILGYNDDNGDGVIGVDELVIGDTAVYVGQGLPQKEASLTSSITLGNRVRIYGLLDYRGDFITYNNTERFRCRFSVCRALMDPSSSHYDQARAVAQGYHGSQTIYGWLEDGDFVKLREVSVSFFLPSQWANMIQASRATLTVTGRNLFTWTDYTGVDPEVNMAGSADNFGTDDFLTQPPLRYFSARLTINF